MLLSGVWVKSSMSNDSDAPRKCMFDVRDEGAANDSITIHEIKDKEPATFKSLSDRRQELLILLFGLKVAKRRE